MCQERTGSVCRQSSWEPEAISSTLARGTFMSRWLAYAHGTWILLAGAKMRFPPKGTAIPCLSKLLLSHKTREKPCNPPLLGMSPVRPFSPTPIPHRSWPPSKPKSLKLNPKSEAFLSLKFKCIESKALVNPSTLNRKCRKCRQKRPERRPLRLRTPRRQWTQRSGRFLSS